MRILRGRASSCSRRVGVHRRFYLFRTLCSTRMRTNVINVLIYDDISFAWRKWYCMEWLHLFMHSYTHISRCNLQLVADYEEFCFRKSHRNYCYLLLSHLKWNIYTRWSTRSGGTQRTLHTICESPISIRANWTHLQWNNICHCAVNVLAHTLCFFIFRAKSVVEIHHWKRRLSYCLPPLSTTPYSLGLGHQYFCCIKNDQNANMDPLTVMWWPCKRFRHFVSDWKLKLPFFSQCCREIDIRGDSSYSKCKMYSNINWTSIQSKDYRSPNVTANQHPNTIGKYLSANQKSSFSLHAIFTKFRCSHRTLWHKWPGCGTARHCGQRA